MMELLFWGHYGASEGKFFAVLFPGSQESGHVGTGVTGVWKLGLSSPEAGVHTWMLLN